LRKTTNPSRLREGLKKKREKDRDITNYRVLRERTEGVQTSPRRRGLRGKREGKGGGFPNSQTKRRDRESKTHISSFIILVGKVAVLEKRKIKTKKKRKTQYQRKTCRINT